MRAASAFRRETPRFPAGERWEPWGPGRVLAAPLGFHFGGGEQRGDACLLQKRFPLLLFPGLRTVWHYCRGRCDRSATLLKSEETLFRESLAQ